MVERELSGPAEFAVKPILDTIKIDTLTPRRLEVLVHMAQGLSNQAIADQMLVGKKAIEAHIKRLFSNFEMTGKDPRAFAVHTYISQHEEFKNPLEGKKSIKPFTQREKVVLALVGQGLSNSTIADMLERDRKTVEHHINTILSKMKM